MRIIYLFLFVIVSVTGFAQTKKIAFKSHSGNAVDFETAVANELFDMNGSDFGLPPEKVQLDSVIRIGDSVAVLISSRGYSPKHNPVQKDTLRGQSLFIKKMPLDSVKKNLRNIFFFDNNINTVKFIGFKKTTGHKKKNEAPLSGTFSTDNYNPFDGPAFLIMVLILVSSLLAGWLAWKFKPVSLP
jgi:hypothetical protein